MPLIPIAAFLAGALLSLLLPTSLLIALTIWYTIFVRRRLPEPETTTDTEAPETASGTEGAKGNLPGGP